ncbi:MAG: translational GTPase TypA [Leptospiraceae bacterium]|nr:translational GTPase TypA [Leptospiraceae bacterium]
MEIRNVSIIAHVDHGKTTLVDGLLNITESLSTKEKSERVMDQMDLEKERGITIKSKNASIQYKGTKINIIDTPGHADFGGEVERVLSMADSSLLLVDAFEGPMPQTRFVLSKSLQLGHKPILVINKIDRDGSQPDVVLDKVFDLFDELGADHDQMDFPVVYASAKNGFASLELDKAGSSDKDLNPILDLILKHVPAYPASATDPLQFQIMNLDYDDYVGRLGIGRVFRGRIRTGDNLKLISTQAADASFRVSRLYGYGGIQRKEIEQAEAGDIVALAGLEEIHIGDTICHPDQIDPRPPITVDEPTVSMFFSVNDSPFAGREGDYVTTRQLRERLFKETRTNVAMRVLEDPDRKDRFSVQGRGDLHLSVLIESMRREGYELQVSRPEVITKQEHGEILEPWERLVIDVPEQYSGTIINELNRRKGEMQGMETSSHGTTRLEYIIPVRGMIGIRGFLLTESRGTAAVNSNFMAYREYAGVMPGRKLGALVSMEDGETVPFALFNIQERGSLFVGPGVAVYTGMIIGESARDNDLEVNPCREKKLTNIRASGSDEAIRLTPARSMSLEQALEFIDDDELLELTPKNIRLRKKLLNATERKRAAKQQKTAG